MKLWTGLVQGKTQSLAFVNSHEPWRSWKGGPANTSFSRTLHDQMEGKKCSLSLIMNHTMRMYVIWR